MKVTSDELNWCKAGTRDTDLHPVFELCALVNFMKQELVKLANLNNEYESFLKGVKNDSNKCKYTVRYGDGFLGYRCHYLRYF